MTEAKPLTLMQDEIAALKREADYMITVTSAPVFSAATVQRVVATIEQRDEQIKRLRETVSDVRITLTVDGRYPTMVERCDKALAAAEPKP